MEPAHGVLAIVFLRHLDSNYGRINRLVSLLCCLTAAHHLTLARTKCNELEMLRILVAATSHDVVMTAHSSPIPHSSTCFRIFFQELSNFCSDDWHSVDVAHTHTFSLPLALEEHVSTSVTDSSCLSASRRRRRPAGRPPPGCCMGV